LCCRSTAEEARDWLGACGRETVIPQRGQQHKQNYRLGSTWFG
jgi:hypothetical protein